MSFFKNGHAASCGVPKSRCICAPQLYVLTGVLAICAGTIQGVMGYWSSLALLSDALHALADGAADFFAAIIAAFIARRPHKEQVLEEKGRKVIALALAAGAAWVIWETVERAVTGNHTVIPWVLAVGGAGGACIDALRLSLLRKAQDTAPNGMRRGLIAHARTDMHRSIIAAVIGGALWAGETAVKAVWFEEVVSYLDLTLSAGLSLYMLYLAKGIWRGEHVHGAHKHGVCHHN